VDPDHKASEDLARMAVWSEKSLRHACEHAQHKLVWLLGAVKTDLEFEGALYALPPDEHLAPPERSIRRFLRTTTTEKPIRLTMHERGSGNRRRSRPGSPPGSYSWKRSVGS
jgi:hypothetical protein